MFLIFLDLLFYFFEFLGIAFACSFIIEINNDRCDDCDNNNAINYMSRARFYMSIGENKKALSDCETILKISPNNKLVLEFKKILIKELKGKNLAKGMSTPKIFLP